MQKLNAEQEMSKVEEAQKPRSTETMEWFGIKVES